MYRKVGYLGCGQFGNVELGELEEKPTKIAVALKTLNRGSSLNDMVKFLQEAVVMAQFRHPNVIKLHGVVTSGKPVSDGISSC